MNRYPIELRESKIANGGSEWWLTVGGERVGSVGVFTDPGHRPEEMLPRVLRHTQTLNLKGKTG